MKKILLLALSAVLVFTLGCNVCAETENDVKVFVTVSDKGMLVIDLKEIEVSDVDSDDSITINDVLITAHQNFYGAETGYAFAETEYGLSITTLWGDTSGSYGYYNNNVSAWSLADPVSNGDYIYAFVYSDTETWSDAYSYFNINKTSASVDESITLTLSMAGYDENWNPITSAVESATILIDGQKTEIKTDADGKALIKIDSVGTHIISAVSDSLTLLPPVCAVEVSDTEESETVTESPESDVPSTPNTGDNSNIITLVIVAVFSLLTVAKLKVSNTRV